MNKLALLFAFCAASALAAEWTGYISETKCGAKHADASTASINCVKGCIKAGAKPVLVVDGTVVPIANAAKVPAELYGLKVQVTGEMKGEAIEIASIEAAK
jgi:hypothetical protein